MNIKRRKKTRVNEKGKNAETKNLLFLVWMLKKVKKEKKKEAEVKNEFLVWKERMKKKKKKKDAETRNWVFSMNVKSCNTCWITVK